MRKIILFAALVAASGLVQADDLIVTGEKAGRGNVVALDYSSSGTATGFEFRLILSHECR